jgi:hypothetical protein
VLIHFKNFCFISHMENFVVKLIIVCSGKVALCSLIEWLDYCASGILCVCPLLLVLAAMLAVRSSIILRGIFSRGMDWVCVISSSVMP